MNVITPSDSQWAAIKKAVAWYTEYRDADDKGLVPQVFHFFGYAGVGKTELAKFLIKEMNLTNVIGACFTGKAAHMMGVRGFPNARTIHSLIYIPIDKGRGTIPEMQEQLRQLEAEGADQRLIDKLKTAIKREIQGLRSPAWMLNPDSDLRHADLLVIDECSMCGTEIAQDLLSFGKPILVLGDPAQLPPVADGGFFTDCDDPEVFLTEIHRNAKDSAIIRMATLARTDGWIPPGVYKDPSGFDSIVAYKGDHERIVSADQILVGHNNTRHNVNRFMRKHHKYDDSLFPKKDERIICLRNNASYGLMNGAMYQVQSDYTDVDEDRILVAIKSEDFPEFPEQEVLSHKILYHGDPKELMPWKWVEAQAFDYGYGITVHKSQGSQWPHIVLNAEWNRKDSWKPFLYTGITRAQVSAYVVVP